MQSAAPEKAVADRQTVWLWSPPAVFGEGVYWSEYCTMRTFNNVLKITFTWELYQCWTCLQQRLKLRGWGRVQPLMHQLLFPAPNSPKRKPHAHSCHPQLWKPPTGLSVWSGLLCTRGLLSLALSLICLQDSATLHFHPSVTLIRQHTARVSLLMGTQAICTFWFLWLVLLCVLIHVSIWFMILNFCMQHFNQCFLLFWILPSFTVHSRAPLSAVCQLWPQKRKQSAGPDFWASPLSILILWPTSTVLQWACLLNSIYVLSTTQQTCQVSHQVGVSTDHPTREMNRWVQQGSCYRNTSGQDREICSVAGLR